MWACWFFYKLFRKIKTGYSPVILITGGTNTGKTCLGALLCEFLDLKINKRIWDPEKFTIFDMDQFSAKFLDAKRTPFLIAEASYDLNYDAWFSKANKFFDRIVTTQRVKENCYIMNVPVAKDLARRQRRKVDYLIDILYWKFARVYNVNVKRRELFGNEFKPYRMGEIVGYPLPNCFKELKKFDEQNKERINEEVHKEYYEETQKIEAKRRHDLRRFICPSCEYEWRPRVKYPKRCPSCQLKLKWKDLNEQERQNIIDN